MRIPISNRESQYFKIDDEDYDLISKYTWCISNGGYITTSIKRKTVRLHRLLLGLVTDDGNIVDHIDCDKCNNCRDNLRLCSKSENNRNVRKPSTNMSGFKGVSKHANKWVARICLDGKSRHLGLYSDIIEAAKAYDKAALELHKEFARLNFSDIMLNSDAID